MCPSSRFHGHRDRAECHLSRYKVSQPRRPVRARSRPLPQAEAVFELGGPVGKIISMHRGASRVRKRDTGEAGNRGEFAAVIRAEADVAVLDPTAERGLETDLERRTRLLQQIEQRSGIDPTVVMDIEQASTAMQISEDQGVSEARTYIESLDAIGPVDPIGAPGSPQRVATSELFADMTTGRCSLPPEQ